MVIARSASQGRPQARSWVRAGRCFAAGRRPLPPGFGPPQRSSSLTCGQVSFHGDAPTPQSAPTTDQSNTSRSRHRRGASREISPPACAPECLEGCEERRAQLCRAGVGAAPLKPICPASRPNRGVRESSTHPSACFKLEEFMLAGELAARRARAKPRDTPHPSKPTAIGEIVSIRYAGCVRGPRYRQPCEDDT